MLGRKKALIIANLLFLIPLLVFLVQDDSQYETSIVVTDKRALVLDFAANILWHAAVRFQAATVGLYIAEVSSPPLRPLFIGLHFLSERFGYIVSELQRKPPIGMLDLLRYDLKLVTGVSLFVLVGCVISAALAVDSPYWLAVQGRVDEAKVALAWLAGDPSVKVVSIFGGGTAAVKIAAKANSTRAAAVDEQTELLLKKVNEDVQQLQTVGFVRSILSARFGIPLMVILVMYFTDNNVNYLYNEAYQQLQKRYPYYDETMSDTKVMFNLSLYYLLEYFLPAAACLLFLLLCLLVRRRIIFFASAMLNLLLFATHFLAPYNMRLVVYSVALPRFFSYLGAKQITRILPPEIFPGITRDIGTSLCGVIEVTFDMIDKYGIQKGYKWFSISSLKLRWTLIPVGLACTYFYMPETKNLTLLETEEVSKEIHVP